MTDGMTYILSGTSDNQGAPGKLIVSFVLIIKYIDTYVWSIKEKTGFKGATNNR
jgi:hypothetical protein